MLCEKDCCTLCFGTLDDDERVVVHTSSEESYAYHSNCFDKVSRATSVEKLKLSALGIYGDAGRVIDVCRHAPARRCCLADCLGKSKEWYMATCSRCDIAYIHKACYHAKESYWLALVRAQRTNHMNDETLRKAMFANKYDIIRMACPCVCGAGFFRVTDLVDDDDLVRRRVATDAKKLPTRLPAKSTSSSKAAAARSAKVAKSEPPVEPSPSVPDDETVAFDGFVPADLVGCPPVDRHICPILRKRMRFPARCSDGYEYEESALTSWLLKFGTSPISCLPATRVTD